MGIISGGPEKTESKGFYEMLWDCGHCEMKGLLGKTQRHCPNCGAPQDADKRYFPKEGEEKRVDGHKFEGSDRHCPSCNAPMGLAAKNCAQCGAPLDGSKEVKAIASKPAPAPRKKIWPYVVGAIVLVIVLIWFFFIRKKDATLAVTGHRWERIVALEKYGDWEDEAWKNEMPSNATGPSCVKKERSQKKVEDGEECHEEKVDKKDGTFEKVNKCKTKYKMEPVEDDWCTFKVKKWKKFDEAKAAGTGMTATWPPNVPAADSPAADGAIRAGEKKEKNILEFGKKGSCDVENAKWTKYKDGDKVKLEVRARSGELVCDSF